MERRRFLAVLASACVAATANAALPVGMRAGNRYIDDDAVRKFKPAKLIGHFKEDKHRVYMFISFTCPFCAQTWREFAEWALGLPPPYRFVYVPVFSGGVQNTAGAAFYVVRELAPIRTPEFLREAFRLQGKPNVTGKDYIGILYKMGFSRTQISQTAKGEITRQRIRDDSVALQEIIGSSARALSEAASKGARAAGDVAGKAADNISRTVSQLRQDMQDHKPQTTPPTDQPPTPTDENNPRSNS